MLTYGATRERLEIFKLDTSGSYALIGTINLATGAASRNFDDLLDPTDKGQLALFLERAKREYIARYFVDADALTDMVFRLSENIERGEQSITEAQNDRMQLAWQRFRFRLKNAQGSSDGAAPARKKTTKATAEMVPEPS